MDKLQELLSRCKCGVHLTVNQHRDYYEPAERYIEDAMKWECPPSIGAEVRAKMIETNTIIELQFYPDTPIGFYLVWHHDLEAAVAEAMQCLSANASEKQP